MARIKKLAEGGVTVYLASIVQAVKDAVSGESLNDILGRKAEKSAVAADVAGLQNQIDTITMSSDVVDVVSSKAELEAYDTSKITENDIVKVLKDESRNGETSYYRLVKGEWGFVGSIGPYYTKAEVDDLHRGMDDEVKELEAHDVVQDERLDQIEGKSVAVDRVDKRQDDWLRYLEYKMGLTPTVQWKSGRTVNEGEAVLMHGEFFIAKVNTQNPPMWCLKNSEGSYITDRHGNYLLTGDYNRTEYQQY